MIEKRLLHALVAIPLLVALATLIGETPLSAEGAGRSVTWQRFDVDLAIRSDGSVNASETQTIHFTGTYQQGYLVGHAAMDWCWRNAAEPAR
jgi:hypothetical protein